MTNQGGDTVSTETWTWEGDSLRSPTGDYFDLDAKGFKEYVVDQLAQAQEAARVATEDAERLATALRLTREYIGEDLLPAEPGWSWFDALARHEERLRERPL